MIDDKMENILLSKCQHKLLVDASRNRPQKVVCEIVRMIETPRPK